jgi:hypothetical protein
MWIVSFLDVDLCMRDEKEEGDEETDAPAHSGSGTTDKGDPLMGSNWVVVGPTQQIHCVTLTNTSTRNSGISIHDEAAPSWIWFFRARALSTKIKARQKKDD